MVPIIITGRNDKITPTQKEHAKEKISKLERYFNGITRIEVVLGKSADQSRAEVVISVKKGSKIVCHCDDKDLYAAIDLVIDKAEIQLTRYKEKLQAKRTSQNKWTDLESMQGSGPASLEPPPGDDLETYDEIVDREDFK